MGLENASDYAQAVVKSDFEQPGDEDVLRKVSQDLSGSGLSVNEGEVRAKMDELLAVAPRTGARRGLKAAFALSRQFGLSDPCDGVSFCCPKQSPLYAVILGRQSRGSIRAVELVAQRQRSGAGPRQT